MIQSDKASALESVPTAATAIEAIAVQDWGVVEYQEAHLRLTDLAGLVRQELAREALVFCHRSPQQVVVYPVLDLNHRARDLQKYRQSLEAAVQETLQEFGIQAVLRSTIADLKTTDTELVDGEEVEASAFWVGSRKIAVIGLGLRKWVSFHGVSINVNYDPQLAAQANESVSPETIVTMAEILGAPLDQEAVKAALHRHLLSRLS